MANEVPNSSPALQTQQTEIITSTNEGKSFLNKKTIFGLFFITLLVAGIGIGLVLLRQEQDIRGRAQDVRTQPGACSGGTCSCANAVCPGDKPNCYVVYQACDSNSATSCTGNAQTFYNGSASLPANSCGTVQIDMGCEGPGGQDTLDYIWKFYPQSCSAPTPTNPPSGGGGLPQCGCYGSGECVDKPNNEGPTHPAGECIFDNDKDYCVWDPGRCGSTGSGGGGEAECQFEQLHGLKPTYKIGETVSVNAIATILEGNFYDMRFRTFAADGTTASQTVVSGINANFDTATCYANGNCMNSDSGTAVAVGTAVIKVFTRVKPCPACDPTATCSMAKIVNIVDDSATPTPTATPTTQPTTQSLSAQCIEIKMYDADWNTLTAAEFSQLGAGNVVRFAVAGAATGGQFEAARFTVNGVLREEVTQVVPGKSEFYDEYLIMSDTSSFIVSTQLKHSSLGWF